ncbi:DUF4376 domain-containing protein, partial [Escherichia coli]
KNLRTLESGAVDCEILFSGMNEYLPYTATPDDTEVTGQEIWQEVQSGKWGSAGAYTPDADALNSAMTIKLAEINQWRDSRESAGLIFEWQAHRWDGGKVSHDRLSPVIAVAQCGELPEGFFWTDADNQDVRLTATELMELESAMLQAMVVHGFRIHERQRQMKEDIGRLETPGEVRGYVVGWGTETLEAAD